MSIIKGFSSTFNALTSLYNGGSAKLKQMYVTLQDLGSGKVGLMTAPRWLATVSSGNTIDAAGSTKTVLAIAGHSLVAGQFIRFTSGANIREEVQVQDASDANSVLLSQQLPNDPGVADAYTILIPMSPTLDSAGLIPIAESTRTVVDFLDNESFAPTGANAIPASSAAPLQVVAAIAADVTAIQIISDVGEFINLYADAAGATLIAHLVLTPDETVDVDILLGSTLYLRNAKNAAINDANSIISMNFIG